MKSRKEPVQIRKIFGKLCLVIIACCILSSFYQSVCSASTVTLQWDPVNDDSLAGYKIYYRTDSEILPFQGIGAVQGNSPIHIDKQTSSTTINGLDPTHSYYFAVTAYNNQGIESPYSDFVYIPVLASALSATISGDGSLNSIPSGMYCNSGTCESLYGINTSVTLFATPSNSSTRLSFFKGWSGACNNSNSSCIVDMTTNKTVTATFTSHPATHLSGSTNYYSNLQTAYNYAVSTSIIEAQAVEISGNLTAANSKNLTIKGGYDATYYARSGYTVVKGTLTVGSGSLVVDNIIISN